MVLSAALAKHIPLRSINHHEGALFGNVLVYSFTISFLSLPLSSLLGRSASPEAEIQVNPPSSSHRTRVSTSPTSYSTMHGSHEHYERIECTYIGSCDVSHGMGMETLNEAVDKLSTVSHRWLNVNVDVATSSIKISDSIVSRNHNIKLSTCMAL